MHAVCMYVTHIPAQMLAGKTPSPGTLNVKGAGYYCTPWLDTTQVNIIYIISSALQHADSNTVLNFRVVTFI
jgi:hypothetical protein